MNKVIMIILALAILYLLMRRSPPVHEEESPPNQFIAQCPPGMLPASYTTAGGDCVPYYF